MIKYKNGELLNSDVEALVNTVNTEGVMGKGIALEFKEAFPRNYELYRKACKDGEMKIGKILVYETESITNPHYIINFPTKKQWRYPSKLEYIKEGLQDLERVIKNYKIKSIAIPPLGCGNGKLNWEEVKPLIEVTVNKFPGLRANIFEPSEDAYKEKVKHIQKKDTGLTTARALVLYLFDCYRILGYDLTLLEAQKLAYFIQRLGLNLKLSYEKMQYGPYAKNLDYLLNHLDGFYITGMKHRNVSPFEVINLIEDRLPEIKKFIDTKSTYEEKVVLRKVIELIEGFESPLGLELLSTVDFIIKSSKTNDVKSILDEISNWSEDKKSAERKTKLFKEDYIALAYNRLINYKDILYRN